MKNNLKKRILYFVVALTYALTCLEPTAVVATGLGGDNHDMNSHNNIQLYNRDCKKGISGACGGDITSEGVENRLREVVEKYGEIAMKMQIEYGPPWELVFAQMVMESGVGSGDGVNSSVEKNGYFNWLGMMFSDNHLYSIPEYYQSPNGRKWSQYKTIGDMIAAWMVDYLRNGIYDDAYQYTDPNNYSLEQFFFTMIQHYCPASDGCDHQSYWKTVKWAVDIADEVASQKGWPTSAELARQENLQIGGKYPVNGDLRKQLGAAPHSLSADCSSSDESLSEEDSNINVNGSKVTMIGDSLTVHSLNELKDTIKGIDIDAKSGTWFDRDDPSFGKSGVNRLKAKGSSMRDIVVFAMGTNGGVTQDAVDNLIKVTGEKRKVVLMTEYISKSDLSGPTDQTLKRNEEVKKAAARYENIVIADWFNAVKSEPGKYINIGSDQRCHPTDEGKKLFAKVIAKGITKTGGSDGSDKTMVNITWQDGWITGGMDGYNKESAVAADAAGKFNLEDSSHTGQFATGGKANKITLHYTVGTDQGGGGGLKLYGGGYPAHFTINLPKKEVFQHFSINQPSDAVASHDKTAGIQIEIIGTGDNQFGKQWNIFDKESYGDEEWIYLATLLVGIGSELGIQLDTSVEWEKPVRFAAGDPGDKFKNTTGIAAHMHVPDNDHTDTGNIWPMLSDALEKVGAGSGKDQCGKSRNSMIEGGLTLEQAEKLAKYYRTTVGGPYNVPGVTETVMTKWNCVSLSRWFTNAFTDAKFGEGNGRDVAANTKKASGLESGTEPQPWGLFSVTKGKTMCGSALCGHTGAVVGVQNSKVITIEAAWGVADYTAAIERDMSYFENTVYGDTFVYFGNHFQADKLQDLMDTL